MALSLTLCPLTGTPIDETSSMDGYLEYELKYNDHKFILRLDNQTNWEADNAISSEDRVVLTSMLACNEWPIEQETVLTPNLISQIVRLGEYPKNFDEKLNYLLLKWFNRGGKEYEAIRINPFSYEESYCSNQDEYARILTGLLSRELIHRPDPDDFINVVLTEKGIDVANQLFVQRSSEAPIVYQNSQAPRVIVVSGDKDVLFAKRMSDLLLEHGVEVVSFNAINKERYSGFNGFRNSLHSEENDYVIFIKSFDSDRNDNLGSLIQIAIEAHKATGKERFKFIFFACIDDAEIDSLPRTVDYHSQSYDFRILTNRKRLLHAIDEDWKKRKDYQASLERYRFPSYRLSDHEKLWMETIYDCFLKNEKFELKELLASLWDLVPNDFDPTQMSPVLARRGSDITIVGINCVDPGSKLILHFERVIFAIRDILKNRRKVDRIESADILERIPDLGEDGVNRIFRLLYSMGGFANGLGSGENGSSISVDDIQVYKRYQNFSGMSKFIEDFIKENASDDAGLSELPPLLQHTINHSEIHAFKTEFGIRDTSSIRPVMGVIELANDISEVIHSLPTQNEKGQMIGIFGRWGRGKSFLCREIWKTLSQKKNIQYDKVEFHAWKYQETPASWAYLYENFVDTFLSKKRCKVWHILRLNIARLGFWPILRGIAFFLAFVTIGYCSTQFLKWYEYLTIMSIEVALLFAFSKRFLKEFSVKALDLVKTYAIRNSYSENLGLQAEIQKELIILLKLWIPDNRVGKEKILLFVDDMDRCPEERIIQNMDALRVLMEDDEVAKRVIIVTAIDERVLKNAIRLKYQSLNALEISVDELVSEYLDKLLILAIKLGGLSNQQKEEFIHEMIAQESDADELHVYRANQARQERDKQWEKTELPDEMINDMLAEPFVTEMSDSFIQPELAMDQAGILLESVGFENGDFAIHNGDFALIDRNGKRTNFAAVDSLTKERIKTQVGFRKLSPQEIEIFLLAAKKLENATPRRIRIFYYRYLLSKNLMINRYANMVNPWQNQEGVRIFMKIILDQSNEYNSDHILQSKAHIWESSEKSHRVTDIVGNELSLSKDDYLILFDVLELVIAY